MTGAVALRVSARSVFVTVLGLLGLACVHVERGPMVRVMTGVSCFVMPYDPSELPRPPSPWSSIHPARIGHELDVLRRGAPRDPREPADDMLLAHERWPAWWVGKGREQVRVRIDADPDFDSVAMWIDAREADGTLRRAELDLHTWECEAYRPFVEVVGEPAPGQWLLSAAVECSYGDYAARVLVGTRALLLVTPEQGSIRMLRLTKDVEQIDYDYDGEPPTKTWLHVRAELRDGELVLVEDRGRASLDLQARGPYKPWIVLEHSQALRDRLALP